MNTFSIRKRNVEGRKAKSKGRWHYLTVKQLSALLRGIT